MLIMVLLLWLGICSKILCKLFIKIQGAIEMSKVCESFVYEN